MDSDSTKRPLNILIAGAGIGGLTAAIGLRKAGHKLFERSRLAEETGAAIHIAPNCHGILRKLGVQPETFGANPVNGIVEYGPDGKMKLDVDLRQSLTIWEHPWVLCHRVRLHDSLKKHATGDAGVGTPAILRTSSTVVDVNYNTAAVTLSDGSTFVGDLVLGADGVSSVTRGYVVGDKIQPFSSGKSAFRFMMPCQNISENPSTKHLVTRDGYLTLWIGNDRRLVMYPCSNNATMNFVCIHPSELSVSEGTGWSRCGSKDAMLDIYDEFGATVRSLLDMIDPREVKVWTLLDMERIPCWVKGRLALLGDAAHPFLPHQGQGGGIAIEDAASLCALLPTGTGPDDIPERLGLYERLRDERAHKIQEFTRQAGADLSDDSLGSFNIMEFINFNFGHDEWYNSTHALKKNLWSRAGPLYWRSPVGFGPSPSPRQDHYGRPIPSQRSSFITHSVRFKTSATYLKTLFPTDDFHFESPGSIAEASFKCTELDGVEWLGGGGYNFFGLWIHGVQYRRNDGSEVSGSFLAVLLESLSDPITTGREELGMPKLFCDVDVEKTGQATTISCSWRGTKFVDITLDGLRELPLCGPVVKSATSTNGTNAAHTVDHGKHGDATLFYRYVPAVGKPGTADAAYAVRVRHGLSKSAPVVDKHAGGRDAEFHFTKGDWHSLPTLHHIATGFSEIPIYRIVDVKAEEGHGLDSLSGAERID